MIVPQPATYKTALEFITAQIRRINLGEAPELLPPGSDTATKACYRELLKLTQQAPEQLQESLSLSVFDALETAIVAYNKKGNLIYRNKAYQRLYPTALARKIQPGLHIGEVLEMLYQQGMAAASGMDKEEFFRLRLDSFGKEETDVQVLIANKWYNRTTRVLPDGGSVTTITDISSVKRTEEQLRQSKANLRAAIDASNQAILLIDRSGNVVVANKTVNFYILLLGIQQKLNQGENIFEFLPQPYNALLKESFLRVLEGESIEFEREIDSRLGKLIFSVSYSPVRVHNGEISAVVISFFDVTEKRKIQDRSLELIRKRSKMKEERVRLAALIQGQETERKRLALDIHDGLGQMLTAIRLQIEMGDNARTGIKGEALKSIQHNIRNTIIEARRIAHDLMPSVLEDFGLSAALKLLINELNKKNKVVISYSEKNRSGRKINESHQLKITLYRIVQEALSNILKHSDATQCTISLVYHVQNVALQISDNGTKFKWPLKTGKGLGVISMKERTQLLKGKFFIEAGSQQNCIIQVVIPLKP